MTEDIDKPKVDWISNIELILFAMVVVFFTGVYLYNGYTVSEKAMHRNTTILPTQDMPKGCVETRILNINTKDVICYSYDKCNQTLIDKGDWICPI